MSKKTEAQAHEIRLKFFKIELEFLSSRLTKFLSRFNSITSLLLSCMIFSSDTQLPENPDVTLFLVRRRWTWTSSLWSPLSDEETGGIKGKEKFCATSLESMHGWFQHLQAGKRYAKALPTMDRGKSTLSHAGVCDLLMPQDRRHISLRGCNSGNRWQVQGGSSGLVVPRYGSIGPKVRGFSGVLGEANDCSHLPLSA